MEWHRGIPLPWYWDIMLIYPYMLFLFTVPHLSLALFTLSRQVHSASCQLGKIAAQRLFHVTEMHLVLARVARVGCKGQVN